MVKLSKAQQRVMDLFKEHPDGKLFYMGYMGRFRPNAYWFFSPGHKNFRPVTINKLLEYGLLTRVKENPLDDGYAILNPDVFEKEKSQ